MWSKAGRTNISILLVILVFLTGVAATVGFYNITGAIATPQQSYLSANDSNQPASISIPSNLGPGTIADIVDKVGPAVVRIDTVTETRVESPFDDPFFRQFFGEEFDFGPREQRSLGSGFIISKDGYILTNQHVIEGAKEVKVTLVGYDKPIDARIVGADRSLDLAILKINTSKSLPFLKLGDVDKVRVGDWAIAIGNPNGLDHTVTVGVISAKGRPIDIENRHYENLLQTDASINPGNSGGPLLNLKGEVIGINTAVNVGAQGIGFAIPSSTVQPVLNDLMTKGKIARPWMGVGLNQVTPDVAEILGLGKNKGALITKVVPGSPAARAGIQKYDIVLEFNGQTVKDPNDLVSKVQALKIGQSVKLKVFRRGKIIDINLVLGEKPSE